MFTPPMCCSYRKHVSSTGHLCKNEKGLDPPDSFLSQKKPTLAAPVLSWPSCQLVGEKNSLWTSRSPSGDVVRTARRSPWKCRPRFYLHLINRLEQAWSVFAAKKLQHCRATSGNNKYHPLFSRKRKQDRCDASDEDYLNEQWWKYLNSALITRLRGGTFRGLMLSK